MITKILIGILAVIGALFIGYVLFSIFFYRNQKVQWSHVINQYREAFQDQPTMNIKDRTEAATNLFGLIDTLVEYTVLSDREYDILLEKKSKNLDVDSALERISKQVFNSINPNVYTDINSIVTETCLMTYIQKRTFVEYFRYLQSANTGAE